MLRQLATLRVAQGRLLTVAIGESISRVTWFAGAAVAAYGVSAFGVGAARRTQTFVNICNQMQRVRLVVHC